MLRISIVESSTQRRLVLEGKLVAPWTAELRTTCERARTDLDGRELVVEIKNLIAINQAGENILAELMTEGIKMRAFGLFTKHVLKQLARRVNGSLGDEEMNYPQQIPAGRHEANEYATREDFCRIFTENLNSFYQLSLVLTRDHEKAEQCSVAGLDDAIKANNVFKEWAGSWAKRAIIKNAIRALQPHPDAANPSIPVASKEQSAMDKLLALGDFERFVFVMSVLERYPEHDCALLLGCSLQDVRTARIRALEQLASSEALAGREPDRAPVTTNATSVAEAKPRQALDESVGSLVG